MVDRPSRTEFLLAALAGASGVAGSYAVAGYSRSFVVAPIDALIVRWTPAAIVNRVILEVGDTGHLLHLGLAVAVAVAALGPAALAGFAAARRYGRPDVGVALAGVLAWGLTAAITGRAGLAVGAGLPVGVVTAAGTVPDPTAKRDESRRRVLGAVASGFGIVGVSFVLGRSRSVGEGIEELPGEGDEAIADRLQLAADRSLDVADGDLTGLVSSIEEFFIVDIAEFEPQVSPDDWSLSITGTVDEPVTVTYGDLVDRPTEHRFLTLRCVGERLNGPKMDTAVWTGTPIRPLLEGIDPDGDCGCAMVHAADDYFVQFPIAALEDGFLAWGMNGEPLPREHGAPVRLLIPGHWGEVNVKWLEEIELLAEEMDGYWETLGWHGTGPVNTVAKLWAEERLDDGRIELAGHAYAGTRGIDRVEVSTDDGATWDGADLSPPLPDEDVWRQWRYRFEPDGTHEVVVRAVDGEGTVQASEPSRAFPSGATGWVRTTVGD